MGVYFVFYDIYVGLCNQKGISPSKAAELVGLSRTSVVKWKAGTIPSGATLNSLAQFFNVTVDYLMGNEQKEKPAQAQAENSELDQAFFRVMKSAQDKGYSAHDIELALDFIKRARERDQK